MKQTKTVSISLPLEEEEGEKELRHWQQQMEEEMVQAELEYWKKKEEEILNDIKEIQELNECYEILNLLLDQYRSFDATCQECWHGDLACGVCLVGKYIKFLERESIDVSHRIKELEGW